MTYISNKDFIIEVVKGNVAGHSLVPKLGQNPDVDTASIPEDIWNLGGTYTGFPTGSPETVDCVSTSASDTGVLTITGLQTSASTEYTSEDITLTGTTPVTSSNSYYRIHTARYSSGTSTGLNVGTISVYHTTTTANVFLNIVIGKSQSNMAGYTVPSGSTAYIINEFTLIKDGGTAVDAEIAFWIRPLSGSPRLRRPLSITSVVATNGIVRAPITVGGGSDIMPRVTATSNNNLTIEVGYDLLIVED